MTSHSLATSQRKNASSTKAVLIPPTVSEKPRPESKLDNMLLAFILHEEKYMSLLRYCAEE